MSHALISNLLEPVFAALGMTIAGVLVAILMRVAKRLGIQVTTEQAAAVDQASKRIVLAVAEKGAVKAADGAEKLAAASTALLAKFPKLAASEVDTHIHAAVAETGVGALAKPAEPAPLPPPPKAGEM